MRKYKNLIFDLDDTLMDTWGQLLQNALTEACQKMIDAGLQAHLPEALAFRQQLYIRESRSSFWPRLVEHFGHNSSLGAEELAALGDDAFHNRHVYESIVPFAGVEEMLRDLQSSYHLFLVTSGNHQTQQQKIHQLEIGPYFRQIYCIDPKKKESKAQAFAKILTSTKSLPSENLSIGNRLDLEIRQAKEMGMDTCYIRHGEYIHMQPQTAAEVPDYQLENVVELAALLESELVLKNTNPDSA